MKSSARDGALSNSPEFGGIKATRGTLQQWRVNKMTEQYQIAEYSQTAAAIAILREKYHGPFDVTTTKGMGMAKEARAEVRGYRVALEKVRIEIKAPALERTRLIDAEAKRITAELLAIEEPIDAAIKAEETRKADEKAARECAEAARVAALQARIDAIRQRALTVANRDAAALRAALDEARVFAPDPDTFAERWPDAMQASAEVRQALETLLAEREAQEARRAEEEARLRAQREELARRQAELDRQREAEEAQRRAEREELARWRAAEEERRQQAADAQARAEQDRQAADAQARRQAEITAKPAQADPLAAIKHALVAGTITGPEAIDQAYQLGFQAGLLEKVIKQ